MSTRAHGKAAFIFISIAVALKRLVLGLIVPVLLASFAVAIAGSPALASSAPAEGAIWANREVGLVFSSGSIGGKSFSPAIRWGGGSYAMFPLNSSVELGLFRSDLQRYVRLNLLAFGHQPQVTRGERVGLWKPDGFVRFEPLSGIWGEGGHFAYAPAAEAGAALRFSEDWAVSISARYALNTTEREASMASIIIGLVGLRPYRARVYERYDIESLSPPPVEPPSAPTEPTGPSN